MPWDDHDCRLSARPWAWHCRYMADIRQVMRCGAAVSATAFCVGMDSLSASALVHRLCRCCQCVTYDWLSPEIEPEAKPEHVTPEPLPCPAWGHQRTEDRGWVRGALNTHTPLVGVSYNTRSSA